MQNTQLDHEQYCQQNREHGKAKAGSLPLCFLLHDLVGPENVGSIFRVADAMGVEKLYLTGSTPVPPHRKIRKTSRSTENTQAYVYEEDPLVVIDRLKASGYVVVSLEITSRSVDIRRLQLPLEAKVCLVLGAENHGVSQALLDVSEHTTHVPMHGENSSMNVAMACAIASFELLGR